jgi:hypothetical protein
MYRLISIACSSPTCVPLFWKHFRLSTDIVQRALALSPVVVRFALPPCSTAPRQDPEDDHGQLEPLPDISAGLSPMKTQSVSHYINDPARCHLTLLYLIYRELYVCFSWIHWIGCFLLVNQGNRFIIVISKCYVIMNSTCGSFKSGSGMV